MFAKRAVLWMVKEGITLAKIGRLQIILLWILISWRPSLYALGARYKRCLIDCSAQWAEAYLGAIRRGSHSEPENKFLPPPTPLVPHDLVSFDNSWIRHWQWGMSVPHNCSLFNVCTAKRHAGKHDIFSLLFTARYRALLLWEQPAISILDRITMQYQSSQKVTTVSGRAGPSCLLLFSTTSMHWTVHISTYAPAEITRLERIHEALTKERIYGQSSYCM